MKRVLQYIIGGLLLFPIVLYAQLDTTPPQTPTGLKVGGATTSPPSTFTTQLLPTDISYQGSFRVPRVYDSTCFSYGWGGQGLGFYPPNNSLFIIGHNQRECIAELTIPSLSQSRDVSSWAVAAIKQPLTQVVRPLEIAASMPSTDGSGDVDRTGDLLFLNNTMWTSVYKYYAVTGDPYDFKTLGQFTPNLSNSQLQGPWHVGALDAPFSSKVGRYLTAIPEPWKSQLQGHALATGRQRGTGAAGSSGGPALFTIGPIHGDTTDSLPLVWYKLYDPITDPTSTTPINHKACDMWEGVAWVQTPTKGAVMFVGRVSLGPVRYDNGGQPGDCSNARGWHCAPYKSEIAFYDPAEMMDVAKGNKNPWDIIPYARWTPTNLIGTCDHLLSAVAYDQAGQRLFIVEYNADVVSNPYEPMPLIHVFKVQ